MRIASYRNTEKGIRAAKIKQQLLQLNNSAIQSSRQPQESRKAFRISFDTIMRRICCALDVSAAEVRSKSRTARISLARQAICYWVRRLIGLSLPLIGRLLGGRDHPTIMFSIRSYQGKRSSMGRKLRVLEEPRGAAAKKAVAL